MNPEVLSETCQVFLGKRYWRSNGYYARLGRQLHVVVWEANNGPVPKGWHVHHINGDPADNRIQNLTCMTLREHKSLHAKRPRSDAWKQAISRSTAAYMARAPRVARTCKQCGVGFTTPINTKRANYCSDGCRYRARVVWQKELSHA